MKKIIIFMLVALMLASGMYIQHSNKQLQDGLYLVDRVLYNTTDKPKADQSFVRFNRDFMKNAPDSSIGLVVNTADFVPLLLQEAPLLLPQTETQKKLQLTFSPQAGEKLEHFTEKNVMRQATMIVDGEALTMNKIRDAIRGGKLEITSSDNECERIYLALKNHSIERSK